MERRRGIMSIRLAVEEMLTERIMDAYSAAGEIQAEAAVIPFCLSCRKHHLVPVEELRDAAEGCQERIGHLHPAGIAAVKVTYAGAIVIRQEDEHMAEVRVHEIVA